MKRQRETERVSESDPLVFQGSRAFGPIAGIVVQVVVLLYTFGSAVGYIVLIGMLFGFVAV